MTVMLMLEGIALCAVGTAAHIIRNKIRKIDDIVDNLVLSIVVGIACFAMFGEPSSLTAVPYMIAGYSSSEFLDWVFKPWWEKE